MKKALIIGDVHLGTSTFHPYIKNNLEYILSNIPEDVSDLIWAGDIIASWKWIQQDVGLRYIVKLFAKHLKQFNNYLIMGNHDLLPKTGQSALSFLNSLDNVTVVNEPLEYTDKILLVPHNYNGHLLEKKYNVVIAHLGLYGIKVNNITYNKPDVLSWHKETKPDFIICGHIHSSELITNDNAIETILVGAISPTNWGEDYPDRIGAIVVEVTPSGEITTDIQQMPMLKTTIHKDTDTNIRTINHDNENVYQEEYTEKIRPPEIRSKGETIEDIIKTVCKEQGVDFDEVFTYLKEIGLQ